jgi:hypothetical protein
LHSVQLSPLHGPLHLHLQESGSITPPLRQYFEDLTHFSRPSPAQPLGPFTHLHVSLSRKP